jgi:hypothetical protein
MKTNFYLELINIWLIACICLGWVFNGLFAVALTLYYIYGILCVYLDELIFKIWQTMITKISTKI